MNTEQCPLIFVDSDDRIIEVATMEWYETPADELPAGIASAWQTDADLKVTLPGSQAWGRIIIELPNGCWEVDLPPHSPGETVTISAGTEESSSMRSCTNHPEASIPEMADRS